MNGNELRHKKGLSYLNVIVFFSKAKENARVRRQSD
jgi:hypothetical protein